MQSRRHSFYESILTTAIGMTYAIPLNYVMINKMTWHNPWTQSVVMVVTFTILSILLKYVMRRIFNAITTRQFLRELEDFPQCYPED